MDAKLTPFPIMWEQFTTDFLTGIFIKKPPPPPPPTPGRREPKNPCLNRNLYLSILSYLCSYLRLKLTDIKRLENETVICLGPF